MKQTRSEKQHNTLHRQYRLKLRRFNNGDLDCGHPVEVDITRRVFWDMQRRDKKSRFRRRPGFLAKLAKKFKSMQAAKALRSV